jgi:hypothetical protein
MQAADPKGRADKDALVTSVHLFKGTAPASHELVSISEETELSAQLASSASAQNDDGPDKGK